MCSSPSQDSRCPETLGPFHKVQLDPRYGAFVVVCFNVNNNKTHSNEGKDSTCLERMEKARPWFSKTQLLFPLSQLMDLVVADSNKTG